MLFAYLVTVLLTFNSFSYQLSERIRHQMGSQNNAMERNRRLTAFCPLITNNGVDLADLFRIVEIIPFEFIDLDLHMRRLKSELE